MKEIPFHPLTIEDKTPISTRVFASDRRNCDLSFANLYAWQFLYDTEVAYVDDWLLFRFRANSHRAYMMPIGEGNPKDKIELLIEDAAQEGVPFLMLGVCEQSLAQLETIMPSNFYATSSRDYADYIYDRETLENLTGKKLQPKRNHINRFLREHPNFKIETLTPDWFEECLRLDERWIAEKGQTSIEEHEAAHAEKRAIERIFSNWDALDLQGLVLLTDGHVTAFTYGSPINQDTFDVCVEKADHRIDGAYAFINREFVRSLPPYQLINREEDLGQTGLRLAKMSYRPALLLQKYAVMTK